MAGPQDPLAEILSSAPPFRKAAVDPLDDILSAAPPIQSAPPPPPPLAPMEQMTQWLGEQKPREPKPIAPPPMRPTPEALAPVDPGRIAPTVELSPTGQAPPPVPGRIPGMERLGGAAPGLPPVPNAIRPPAPPPQAPRNIQQVQIQADEIPPPPAAAINLSRSGPVPPVVEGPAQTFTEGVGQAADYTAQQIPKVIGAIPKVNAMMRPGQTQVAPEEAIAAAGEARQPLVKPSLMIPDDGRPDATRELIRGAVEGIEGLSSPENIAVIATTGGIAKAAQTVANPAVQGSLKAATTALSLYFTGQAGKGAYEAGKTAWELHEKGDDEGAARYLGLASTQALFAVLGVAHAAKEAIGGVESFKEGYGRGQRRRAAVDADAEAKFEAAQQKLQAEAFEPIPGEPGKFRLKQNRGEAPAAHTPDPLQQIIETAPPAKALAPEPSVIPPVTPPPQAELPQQVAPPPAAITGDAPPAQPVEKLEQLPIPAPGPREEVVQPVPVDAAAPGEVEKPREFSSTQVNLPPDVADRVRQTAAKIPDEDLAEDGRENEPHTTVKFGLHTNNAEDVRPLLANEPPVRVKLGKVSLFENDDADVVKIDVDSPDLHRLNKKIADALPHTDTRPEYNPHVTIAYVKPGMGRKYLGLNDLEGQEITLNSITFSGKDRQKIEIPLGGRSIESSNASVTGQSVKEPNAPLPPQAPPPPGFVEDAAVAPVQAQPVPETPAPVDGRRADPDIFRVPTNSLAVDPHRFQYKVEGIGQGGVNEELKASKKWDPALAGVISVWRDPANGQTYVVNGHHRFDLASRLGVPELTVRYIDAPDAKTARARGALMNIAEGRGTAVDAAKFMRDTDMTPQDMEEAGVSLKGMVAREGAALANLAPSLFDDVVHGNLPQKRAVIIGESLPDHADQMGAMDVLRDAERRGKRLNDAEVKELIRRTAQAERKVEQQDTLFGVQEMTQNLALEEAQLSHFVRSRLGNEKKLFSTVGSQSAADRLGAAGNKIDAEANKQVAEQAVRALAVYDKLSLSAGPISDALREGARRIANGEKLDAVKEGVYTAVRDSVSKLLGGKPAAGAADVRAVDATGKESGTGGIQEGPRQQNAPVGNTVELTKDGLQETLVTDREAKESQIAAKNDRTTPLAEVPFSLSAPEAPAPTGPDPRQESMFGNEQVAGYAPKGNASFKPGTPSKAAAKPTTGKKTRAQVSRGQIVSDLSGFLNNIPIRTGGFSSMGKGVLGIFKPKQSVIRTAKALDLPTIAHEIGHAIHKYLWGVEAIKNRAGQPTGAVRLSNKPFRPFRKELGRLDYDPKQQRPFEGFAEYIRLWLTEPGVAQQKAPNFHRWFEKMLTQHPDLAAVIDQARARIEDWNKQPAAVKVAASIQTESPKVKKWMSTLDNIVEDIFDSADPVLQAEEQFAAAGAPVEAARGAHSLMQRLSASASRAERMVTKGTFSGDPATKYKDVGKSLISILEPLGDRKESDFNPKWNKLKKDWGVKVVGDNLDDFRVYVFARRMAEYQRNEMETGFTPAEIQEALQATETPAIKKAGEEWHNFNDEVLQYAVDKKALTQEQADTIRSKYLFYTHIDRIMDSQGQGSGGGTKMLDGSSAIMRAKGSTREIEDPLSSALKNTYALVKWADEQEVIHALVEQAMRADAKGTILETGITRPPKGTKFNLQEIEKEIKKILTAEGVDITKLSKDAFDSMVSIWRSNITGNRKRGEVVVNINGQPEIVYMDEALIRAFDGMTPASRNFFLKAFKVQADILRTGATSMGPEFTLRNFFNDQVTAAMQSQHGYLPIIDGIQGALSLIFDQQFQDAITKAGGRGATFTPRNIESSTKFINSAIAGTTMANRLNYTLRHPMEMWNVFLNAARTPGEFLEAATRTGEARLASKAGKSMDEVAEAYRRVTLDFGVQGRKVRSVSPYHAYLGAKLNGTRRFYQEHKKNPGRTFMRGMAYIGIPTLALWLLNKDDPEYWEQEEWKRGAAWLIPTKYFPGGTDREKNRMRQVFGPFIPIPRANLYGMVYGNMVERALDKAFKANPDAFKGLTWQMFSESVPISNIVPTGAVVPLELLLGRKIFNLAPIESTEDMKQTAPYRSRPNTSDFARVMGRASGVSPLKIDHFIFGNTAGLGRAVVTNGIDPIVRAADKASGGTLGSRSNPPAKQLSDITFFRAFSTPDSPQSPASLTKFYDEITTLKQKDSDAKEALKRPTGQAKGAPKLTAAEKTRLTHLEKYAKMLGKVRQAVKDVEADEKGDPVERREKLVQLNRKRINIAREALGLPVLYK